jgi:hypothetical protein
LSLNPYFRKYLELVYRKNVGMVIMTTSIMFLLFICMHFWVWGILQRWPAFAPTTYEVVCNYWKFENHRSRKIENNNVVAENSLVSQLMNHYTAGSFYQTQQSRYFYLRMGAKQTPETAMFNAITSSEHYNIKWYDYWIIN